MNSFGNGMVIPFMFIYLHNVRGIGLGVVGLIVAAHAVVSIVAGPVFGSQIDRFGGKRMLALSLAILAIGYAGYALVHEPWQGFLVAIVSGIGVGGFWPSQSTLIAGLTPAEQRPSAFAMQRVVMNLGIGLGALTGGLIAATDSPAHLLGALPARRSDVPRLRRRDVRARARSRTCDERSRRRTGSYRDVLRHRAFVAVIALNALFIFAGFSGLRRPPRLREERGRPHGDADRAPLPRQHARDRLRAAPDRAARARPEADADAGALRVAAGPAPGSSCRSPALPRRAAFMVLAVVMVVFAIGQCLHGAVAAPLAADLAEPRLMGRYMALNALSWQIGFALGPALGGAGLAVSPTASGSLRPRSALTRRGLHAARRGRVSRRVPVGHRSRAPLRLDRKAPRLQSRTWR